VRISSVGIAAKPIDGVYLKDIIIESAATEIEIAHTRHLEMQNVRVNGRLLSGPTGETSKCRAFAIEQAEIFA
jgi:hypothetical protein